MKKSILSVFIIITSLFVNAQQKFPYYYIKNGDTLGVVVSIEQAQKIDNDYDLLYLFKQARLQNDKVDSAYVVVINNLGQEVTQLKLKISTLESLSKTQDEQINNLKTQIEKYKQDVILADRQSAAKDTIISNNKKEIRKLKTQRFFGFTVGGGGLIGVILLLLLK